MESPPPSTEAPPAGVIVRAATDELWRRGVLGWKLHREQLVLYGLILACAASRFVLELARRFGKTWLLVVIAVETCLRNPGSRVVYGAPSLKHLEEFIIPAFEAICEDAPTECRPVFSGKTGHWTFPNGAYVHLFGADDKRKADRGRGAGAILELFDECGFTPVLRYALRSVLRPQMLHTRRKPGSFAGMTLRASTPAEEPDHDFTEIAERAEANGNYARRTLYENPLLTAEEIQRFLEEDAKEEGMSVEQYKLTDDFRREWLAERVVNKLLVVMGDDWGKSKEKCLALYAQHKRPEFYDGMTVLDPGGNDPHAALFGYWHFPGACLVVEEEMFLHDGENTEDMQAEMKRIETALWGTDRWDGTLRAFTDEALLDCLPDWVRVDLNAQAPTQPYARWCDNNIQLARDLYELHEMVFIPTTKDDKELAINAVRVAMRAGKIAINPKLQHLIRHLNGTVWANNKRRDYKRRGGEHGDCLDALVYMQRNVNTSRNPYPAHWKNTPAGVAEAAEKKRLEQRKLNEALLGSTPLGRRLLKHG